MTFLAVFTFNAEASIYCHTPRMNKVFKVTDTKVTFYNEFESLPQREIASLHARKKQSESGITKIVDFENQKHTIHISNMNSFSDVNDYIIIRSRTGHEVTYPLTCEVK